MTGFSAKLTTQLAVLAIMSAATCTQVQAQFRPPPPSPPTSPPASTTTPPPSTTTSPPASTNSPPPTAASPPPPPSTSVTFSNNPTSASHSTPTWSQQGDVADVPERCSSGQINQLPDPRAYGGDIGGAIKAISRASEHIIERCCNTQECIADALDNYAAALAQLAPQLPPQLQNLPNIVATAAARVRVARTRTQAIHALSVAISAVHKTIALLRADDSFALKAGTRAGGFVGETLQVATLKLENAAGL
jgi:hypothetical protein